ncbi:dihydroorotase, partial [Ruminococcaceae bacterium OttesenSCG-928-L11]|nr:dihydroorotase [Ruminococcaceae bacterium OttesenSCG-928-L11]
WGRRRCMSVVLKNARMTDSRRERRGDLLIENGKIKQIGANLTGDRVIDAAGRMIMPSFVDMHTHFRDPGFTHKEDIETGSRAAVHGGYTFVNLMANTNPVCSDMETVRYVLDKARATGLCDVHQVATITDRMEGTSIDHIDRLDFPTVRWLSDDGKGVQDTAVMLAAMRKAGQQGFGLMLHEEDPAMTHVNSALAEEFQTYRDVELAVLTGCKTHFCHVSTAAAMEFIIEGKKRSRHITCEVTPHHLMLNNETKGNVAPPLRPEEDRSCMVEYALSGHVDAIATDHAPHTPEEKAAGINGFTGLDLSFATCYTILVRENGMPLTALSRMLSFTPAGLMGLPPHLIDEGMDANLVLLDLDTPFTVTEEHIHSKSKNTPMLGKTLYGTVCMTIKGGAIVYENISGK